MICGADGWLRTWLELPNGIPSHDTLGRAFARLDPQQFMQCFASWMAAVRQASSGQLVAMDGKTLRGSGDSCAGQGAMQLVGPLEAASQVLLAQVEVEEGVERGRGHTAGPGDA